MAHINDVEHFMPWQEEKDHYNFAEVAKRWNLSIEDLGYFAERGLLQVQTWLSDAWLIQYQFQKTVGGDVAAVQTGVSSVTGYVIVDPNELRKIFRSPQQSTEVRKFTSPDTEILYAPPFNAQGCVISVGVLEITLEERNRFEIEWNLNPVAANMNKTGLDSLPLGRPTIKQLLIARYFERDDRGQAEKTLTAESRYHHAWAQNEWGEERAPKLKTIVNNLRQAFKARNGMKSSHKKARKNAQKSARNI
jgi:hypothetical protein